MKNQQFTKKQKASLALQEMMFEDILALHENRCKNRYGMQVIISTYGYDMLLQAYNSCRANASDLARLRVDDLEKFIREFPLKFFIAALPQKFNKEDIKDVLIHCGFLIYSPTKGKYVETDAKMVNFLKNRYAEKLSAGYIKNRRKVRYQAIYSTLVSILLN